MEAYNPWWIGEPDPAIEEWAESRVKWVPSVIKRIRVQPYALHFLVGPRQVGKTTALKLFIHELLKEMNPRSIFYYPCDELDNYEELGEVLDFYLSARKVWGIKSSVIVLDEVTFVKEWFRALKSRIDMGVFKNDVLIVTGSASLELVAGRERFPGRRGNGVDIVMYPMSFSEYVLHFSKLSTERAALEDMKRFETSFRANKLFSRRLSELFGAYLITGGFPLSIREFFEKGRVTHRTHKAYLDWLRVDWTKAGRSEGYMKEVISYILEATPSPISWHSIAKATSLSSPNTARSYVETLEHLMVAKVLYWASPSGKVDYRKEKKILLTDPLLYHVFEAYTRVRVDEAALVEATFSTHLARRYPVYYWRDKSEVDTLVLVSGRLLGLEVKWRYKPVIRRKPLPYQVLHKEEVPIYLATLNIQ